jgi:hypothetical protein
MDCDCVVVAFQPDRNGRLRLILVEVSCYAITLASCYCAPAAEAKVMSASGTLLHLTCCVMTKSSEEAAAPGED